MKRLLSFALLLSSATYACPQSDTVLEAVKALGIPIKEVKKVEPFKAIPGLCRAEGLLEKGGATAEVDFYLTADGRYMLPFVGTISYKPAPIEGFKEIWISSLRNKKHRFKLGYISEGGKYYVPEMVPVGFTESEKGKENKNSTQRQ